MMKSQQNSTTPYLLNQAFAFYAPLGSHSILFRLKRKFLVNCIRFEFQKLIQKQISKFKPEDCSTAPSITDDGDACRKASFERAE